VTRDKAAKTRRVEVPRLVPHPIYGKIVKKKTVCHVHDEKNESHNGDTVEIQESKPLSALKRWTLVRIVTKGPAASVIEKEGTLDEQLYGKKEGEEAAK
jgi:small subunit ribosomal protein S17